MQTKQLDVLFSGSDFLLIRPHLGELKGKKPGETVTIILYELKKGVVKVIIWCG